MDHLNNKDPHKAKNQLISSAPGWLLYVDDEFLCSMSKTIMKDPYVTKSGSTCEYSNIPSNEREQARPN